MKLFSFSCVTLPPIFCGSSKMMMGRFALITSIGRREPNSSLLESIINCSLLFFFPSATSEKERANACVLMIITLMPELLEKLSSWFRLELL